MPKNKKPAGGRPAKNFEPGYARKSGGPAGTTTGSRSPGHRGYRPTDDAEAWAAEVNSADADPTESGKGPQGGSYAR